MTSFPKRLLVAFSAVLLSSVFSAGVALADTKESSTGIQFKDAVSPPGAAGSLGLLGVGVRTKTFLKVKVYAAGLYADA
ncbi:MAG: hypothetical protein R3F39_17835, partial [Myxococcota bacterium]